MYHIESKQVSGQQFNQGIRKTCMCQYTKQADAQGNGVSGIACTDLLKPAFWSSHHNLCKICMQIFNSVSEWSPSSIKFVQFENYTLVDMSSLQNVNFVSKTKG